MDWTSSSRCEVMKLRLALLGMNIDLSQGRRGRTRTISSTRLQSLHLHLNTRSSLVVVGEECLEIYERRMLNTGVPVSQERICSKLKKMAPQLRSRR